MEAEDKFTDEDVEELESFFLEHYDEFECPVSDVRLDVITVDNFKIINDREVTFDRQSSVLYGRNSKGKTSLIRAILFNIAGQPEQSDFGMTKLIQKNKSTLNTTGLWTIDDTPYTLERSLRQSGRGGGLSGADEPYLSEGHDMSSKPSISGKYTDPSEVLRKFGLLELRTRHHDPFEVLALCFLMAEDFTRFLGRGHSDLIDLLFGINITTVVTAAENQINDLELSDVEKRSAQQLRKYQGERERLETKISEVTQRRESILEELKEKQDRLESLDNVLSGESKLEELRRRRSELRSREADLKVERSETIDELARVRRLIERHEDTEIREDLSTIADELRNFMTVPDRCPICTNPVDSEQRERLVHQQLCPLCAKEMPPDRYRHEVEHLERDSVTDGSVQNSQDHVSDLRNQENELVLEKQRLERHLETTSNELQQLTAQIQENNLTDLAAEQETLQREVRMLRDGAVELGVEADTLEAEIRDAKRNIKANEILMAQGKAKDNRRQTFKRFKNLIEKARSVERQELKESLASQMESLFKHFEHGTLETAHEVRFKPGDSYHFEIATEDMTLDSSIPDESNAEINLHALLFHTAVLKHMSKAAVSLPLRMFVIDSPFANEVDKQNAQDISHFLSVLPEILPSYQIIIASAETEAFNPENYRNNFQLLVFS